MALIIPCDAANYYYSLAISYSHLIPWAITGALYVAYSYSGDGVFSIVSWALTFMLLPMYPMRAYFNDLFSDPFCGMFKTWAFPNMECATVAALLVYAVFFRWYYRVRISWFQWIVAALIILMPPVIMVVIAKLAWWKVLLSALWGVGFAFIICPIIWINQNGFAYLYNVPGFDGWYNESVLLRDAASVKRFRWLRSLRREEAERRADSMRSAGYSWRPFSILSSKYGSTNLPSPIRPLPFGTSGF